MEPLSNKIQYLIDWKTFYETKSHKLYPGALCFPQFFIFSVTSLLNKYWLYDPNAYIYTINFFRMLPWIVNKIFKSSSSSSSSTMLLTFIPAESCENKLKNLAANKNNFDLNAYFLEYYLANNESVNNYRKSLLNITLEYYDKKNISDFIQYLIEKECCFSEEKTIIPPPSDCYVLLSNSNNTPLPANLNFTTLMWGPIYWNIFHTIGEIEEKEKEKKEEDDDDDDDDYYYCEEVIKNSFIHLFPGLLPCSICTMNYYRHIKPSEIIYFESEIYSKEVYDIIHQRVTNHVNNNHHQQHQIR